MLHVAAVWRPPGGDLTNIAIVPEGPRSATDAFVLGLARARADAIVTTGACLRAEPGLRHALADTAQAAWRRERLGRRSPPLSVVLTRGPSLDLRHVLFEAPALVFTGESAAPQLVRRARELGLALEVVGREPCDLAALMQHLRVERGLETIDVEAGPRTAATLYAAPGRVDELLLSVFCEPRLAPAAQGGAFVPESRIEAVLGPPLHEISRDEQSGRWIFRRYRRAPGCVTRA